MPRRTDPERHTRRDFVVGALTGIPLGVGAFLLKPYLRISRLFPSQPTRRREARPVSVVVANPRSKEEIIRYLDIDLLATIKKEPIDRLRFKLGYRKREYSAAENRAELYEKLNYARRTDREIVESRLKGSKEISESRKQKLLRRYEGYYNYVEELIRDRPQYFDILEEVSLRMRHRMNRIGRALSSLTLLEQTEIEEWRLEKIISSVDEIIRKVEPGEVGI